VLSQLPDVEVIKQSALADLINRRNGFFAFDRALEVFPLTSTHGISIASWNNPSTWKNLYGKALSKYTFFAHDVFGEPFGIDASGAVVKFDPETNEITSYANDLESWCEKILADPNYEVGSKFAHEWTQTHAPIAEGKRLVPITPFVLEGEYALSNFMAIDALEGMKFRASIYWQIENLPDGAEVRIRIDD